MAARKASSLLKASVLATLSFASGAASAQIWTGGTPYGGTIRILLQSQDGQTLFAETNSNLFRSDDGGLHWSRKLAGTTDSGPAEFAALAISGAHPGRLWLADARGGIHRSDDNGESIAATTTFPVANAFITQLLVASGMDEWLFVATSNAGLWYSTDAGASFAHADEGIETGTSMTRLAISPYDPSRLIAFQANPGSQALYLSPTGGIDWNRIPSDFHGRPTAGAFTSNQGLFVATDGQYARLWRMPSFGWWIVESTACWQTNSLLLDVGGENVEWMGCGQGLVGMVSPPVAPPTVINGVEAPIRQLLRDRTSPDRLWAATEHVGVFTSADAGRSWTARNQGLSGTSFRSVAVHPHSHRLYAGYVDEYTTTTNPSVMFSDDDGATWTNSNLGGFVLFTRAIVVDPTVQNVDATPVYAGATQEIGTPSGLYKSLDGGRTFSVLGGGSTIRTGTVRDIALDPRSCKSPPPSGPCASGPLRTFYAIASGDAQSNWRVIRSDDAGATLQDRSAGLPPRMFYPGNTGIEYNYPVSIALDPIDTQTVYIGTYLYQNVDSSIETSVPTPTLANGVFRSRDGGSTWQAVNSGLPRNGNSADTAIDIYALAADPHVTGRLWAAGAFHDGGDGSRVFRSDDAGDHWSEQAVFADCDIRRLLADPQRPGTIRASGVSKAQRGSGCVLRSRDSGESWSRIDAGLPATRVLAMASMPDAPDTLLVGTNHGVWHLLDAPDHVFGNGFD